ncbi:hypothetical protein ACM79B_16380 [Pseudomonas aeruginosa]
MITNNSKAPSCTCPSGDGSLVHPCPAHPASVKQTGGDERAVDGKPRATKCPDCGEGDLMPGDLCACGYETDPAAGYACSECDGSGDGCVGEVCRECDGSGWFVTPEQARAALAQPSPAPTLRAAIDVANDRFEVPVAKWGTDLAGEKERPEVVAFIHERTGTIANADMVRAMEEGSVPSGYTVGLMSVAQHERIVASSWERAMDLMGEHVARISEKLTKERDAALARAAELDQALAEKDPFGAKLNRISEKLERCDALLAARAAQAGQVPQAWLDVQAERRRQVDAEGWTPEHDDLYCAAELPRAAAAYILSGANDEAPAIWPFVAKWWKPRDARTNYVRAGALLLAEIERLDRAAATQGGPRDA